MKQDSNDTGSSTAPTRLTRSQNPAFVAKQRSFLQKVTGISSGNYSVVKVQNEEVEEQKTDDACANSKAVVKRKRERSVGDLSPGEHDDLQKAKTAKLNSSSDVILEKDKYCWTCHKEGVVLTCHTCPRSFHLRCSQMETVPCIAWMCPECATIMHAENVDTRSAAMKQLTLDRFCSLLKFALNRLKSLTGSEPFWRPVDQNEFSRYREFVVHPMDFTQLEYNIRRKAYGSTEAFIADVKWILHDCIVFNTQHTKLTSSAKYILKVCKQEMAEIEICPDCYYNANTLKDSWFIEACRKPHVLVWAKLKGYPYWPGKVLRVHEDNADVRFFGAHDRAWVSVQCCYLYSREMPAPVKSRKHELQICIKELDQHTKKLKDRFGRFQLPASLTPFEPTMDQITLFLPNYKEEVIRMRRFKSRNRAYHGEGNENMENNGDPLAIRYELPAVTHQVKLPKEKRSKSPSLDRRQFTEKCNGVTTEKTIGRASLTEWSKFEEEAAQIKLSESDIEDSEISVEVPSKKTKCDGNVDSESGNCVVNEPSKSFGKSGIVDILQKKLLSLQPTRDTPELEVRSPAPESQSSSDNNNSQHPSCLQLGNTVNPDADSGSKEVPSGAVDADLNIDERLCDIPHDNITSVATNMAFSNTQKTDFVSTVDPLNINKDFKEMLPKELVTEERREHSEPGLKLSLEKEINENAKSPVLDAAETDINGKLLIETDGNEVPFDSALKLPENESICSNSLESRDSGLDADRASDKNESANDLTIRKDNLGRSTPSVSSVDIEGSRKISFDVCLEEKSELSEKKLSTELSKTSEVSIENCSEVISFPQLSGSGVKQLDNSTEQKVTDNKLTAEPTQEKLSHTNVNIVVPAKKQILENHKDTGEESLLKDENFNQQLPYGSKVNAANGAPINDVADTISDIQCKESESSNDNIILLPEKDSSKDSNSEEAEKDAAVLSVTVTTSDAVPEHGYSRRTSEAVTITVDKAKSENLLHSECVKSDTLVVEKCGGGGGAEEEVVVEEVGGGEEEVTSEPVLPSEESLDVSSECMNIGGEKERENFCENVQLSLCDNKDSQDDKTTSSVGISPMPEIALVKSVPEQHWKNLAAGYESDCPDTSDEHIVLDVSAGVRNTSGSEKETSDYLSYECSGENKDSDVSVGPSGIRVRDVSVMCVKRKAREVSMNTACKKENMSGSETSSDVKISKEMCVTGGESSHEAVILNQPITEESCVTENQNVSTSSMLHFSTSAVCEEEKEANVVTTEDLQPSENAEIIKPNESNLQTVNSNTISNKTMELVKASDDVVLPFDMVCEHESDEEAQNENDTAEENITNQTMQAPQMSGTQNVVNDQREQYIQKDDQREQCMQETGQKTVPNRSNADLHSDATTTTDLNTCKTVLVGIKYSKQVSSLDIPGRATPESVILLPNSRGGHDQYNNIVENNVDETLTLESRQRNSPVLGVTHSHLPCATSDAGPNTAEFHRHADKIGQICCSTLQEILHEWSNEGDERATIKALQLEIEKLNWQHKQEIAELRHNADLIASELRANLLTEHRRLMNDAKRRWEAEKRKAVEETKKKQWCSYCGKEAIFYCCWNTSYCDTNCQKKHWPHHVAACRHISGTATQEESAAPSSVPQQPQVFGKPVISLQPQKSTHLLVPSVPLPTINRQPGVRYSTVSRSPTILGTTVQVVTSKSQPTTSILSAPATSGNLYFTAPRISGPPALNRINSTDTSQATLFYPATYSQAGSRKTGKVTHSSLTKK